ncbi:MAG: hypothetical protein QNK31_00730 [Porticoccus sp.]|nr:hypothetical protein [Porticoccus sp.]
MAFLELARFKYVRDALLSLSRIHVIDKALRLAYVLAAKIAAIYLGSKAGVTHVYVRRSFANLEFRPLLSDIDLTVIVADELSNRMAVKSVRRLSRCIPLIEPESVVINADELRRKLRFDTLPYDLAVMHRYVEAQYCWKLTYKDKSCPDIDLTSNPSQAESTIFALYELLYWSGVVTRYSSAYICGDTGRFTTKLVVWNMCKAILEVDNLVSHVEEDVPLSYSRSEMLQSSISRYRSTPWGDLLSRTEAIFRGGSFVDNDLYLTRALSFLAMRFAAFVLSVSNKCRFSGDYLSELRCASKLGDEFFPDEEPVDVKANQFRPLFQGELDPSPILKAVLLARTGNQNKPNRWLVLIVLSEISTAAVDHCRKMLPSIHDQVMGQMNEPADLCMHVVHNDHLLALNVPELYGSSAQVLWSSGGIYTQCCIELMLDASETTLECANSIHKLAENVLSVPKYG